MGNVLKRIIKNEYIYSVLTRFISLCLSMVQSALLARFLGASLQGTSAYIYSITSIGSVFITFGMHQAYPFFRKKYGKDSIYNDYLSIVLIIFSLYLILALIGSVLMPISIDTKIAIVIMPLLGYANVVEYITLIEKPNKRNTMWTIIHFVDVVYCVLLFLVVHSNYFWLITTIIFAPILKSIMFTMQLEGKICVHRGQIKLALELFKFGFWPMIALLMTTLNYKLDVLMLNSFDNVTKSMMGIYSIGMTFADKVAIIPDTLKGVLVSKLAKGADEHEVAKVARICTWVSGLLFLFFLILGKPIINMLYGKEYEGAYEVLVICAVGSIFVGYFKLIAQYNIINKKQIRNVILLSGSILINVILNWFLIPKYALSGAAFASSVGYLLSGIVFVFWFALSNKIKVKEMILPQSSDISMLRGFIAKATNKGE